MKSKQIKSTEKPAQRRNHTEEFIAEALKMAERVGVTKAAKELDVAQSQIYYWRSRRRLTQDAGQRESQLATENARLKREVAEKAEELAILKKAAAYFAKSLK